MPLLATPDPGTVSKPDQQYWLLPLVLQLSVEVEAAAVEQQPKLVRPELAQDGVELECGGNAAEGGARTCT